MGPRSVGRGALLFLGLYASVGYGGADHASKLRRYWLTERLHAGKRLSRADRESILPSRPELPKQGVVHVREFIGDEFYRGTVAQYRREGFEVAKLSGIRATAKRGRLRIVLHKGDKRIFQAMKDPGVHAILYSGHSDVGGVVEGALAERGVRAQRGSKMLAMLNCIGVQSLPFVAAEFPRAHVITTRDSSYDEDDRIARKAIIDGLETGGTYRAMRKAISKARGAKNYLFPDMVELTRHLDLDRDGRLDAHERNTKERGFRKATLDGRRAAPAEKLTSAARYLHSTNRFYVEEVSNAVLTEREARTPVVPAGTYAGDGKTVSRAKLVTRGGKHVFEVSLDEKYLTEPKSFVGAATVYETALAMHERFAGKVDARAKRRAYAFAADYVTRQIEFTDEADRGLARLARMKGLPALPSYDVYKYEYPHMLGSDKQLERIERLERLGVRIGKRK